MATRSLLLAAGITGVALAAAGCSSSSSTPAVTPTAAPSEIPSQLPTEAPTAVPTKAPTKAATGGSATLPKAPAGAKLLSNHKTAGAEYARYKIGMSPKQVVSKYQTQAQNNGFTIEKSGGGGGGWGGWGGSDYGMTAKKGSTFEDVQAGGESSGPTYYEVCVGTEQRAYDHCEERSQNDHRDSNSRGS